MGSLISKPKAPKVPKTQIVYVPAPVASAPTTTQDPTAASGSSSNSSTAGTGSPAQLATSNLLLRDRGIFGTDLTGFTGLLAPAADTAQRKTLLGE